MVDGSAYREIVMLLVSLYAYVVSYSHKPLQALSYM